MPGAVLAYLLASLRDARRMLVLWLLAGMGLAAVAVGLGLAIFALSTDPEGSRRLAQESALGTGALGALWLLARALDSDRRSGFCAAADQAAGGVAARWVGRWAGAVVAGLLCALPAMGAGWWWVQANVFCLLLTTASASALAAAWALALHALGWGGVAVWLGSAALWVLGHLPWGAAGWGGPPAAWLGGLLPPGTAPASGLPAPSAPLATLGLLALALARARPVGAGESARESAGGGSGGGGGRPPAGPTAP